MKTAPGIPRNQDVCVGDGPFRYHVDDAWPQFSADGTAGEAVAVACDARDRVYVFLRGPSPVRVFEPDGTFVTAWGEGLFVRPHGITIGPDDTVYLTDDLDHTIRKFTPDGTLLLTFGKSGVPSDSGATSQDF